MIWWDYIIDANWGGEEGALFDNGRGTFRIYSSLKAAAKDRVPFDGRTWVGPGTYKPPSQ